ncbi:hypothetical protein DNTS_011094 [Danionella cerebrum]|uniref:Uncharacterized protein n=1 Tax=Danionella cerebrum TaxID=2873325 RepID=A0A553RP11_9TELE|nr:hypothetical protein DNTS_011094 [Danionella translucida]
MTERARGPSDVHPAEGYGWVSMCLLRGHATSAPLSCSREKVPEVEEKEVALHHGATHLFRRRLRVEGCLVLSESRSLQRWEAVVETTFLKSSFDFNEGNWSHSVRTETEV